MACPPSSGSGNCQPFFSADDLRNNPLCNQVVFKEICAIQSQILESLTSCTTSLIIDSGTPMTTGTGIIGVTVVDGGVGYFSTPPSAEIVHPLGFGAEPKVNETNGVVTSIEVISSGNSYDVISASADAQNTGNGDAIFQVLVNPTGQIYLINPLVRGTGYSVGDEVLILHPFGQGATAEVSSVGSQGEILTVNVTNGGVDYQSISPTVVVNHPNGFGFSGSVSQVSGGITNVTVLNGGAGYQTLYPQVSISGTGTGAKFNVIVDEFGEITDVVVTKSGSGYSSADEAEVLNALLQSGSGAEIEILVSENSINSNLYYRVWRGLEENSLVSSHLERVQDYFKCLGYKISIGRNESTGDTIIWKISW